MDMLNKLKSSLSSSVTNTIQNTVYHSGNIISGVIPGNPVTREFEITSHVGSAGPGLSWKVYSAVKKSTRQPASVFVLEKSQLDQYDKQDREILWELFKKGASQLTRLRHPQILTVEHPLEESRDCLAFASEPVLASLANVLGWHENLASPLPQQLTSFKLFPVEMKYGLLQVSEGLSFLHASARMLHRNISPESIVINSQGAWKISGFEYCLGSTPGGQEAPSWDTPEYDHALPSLAHPHLDYSAPELANREVVNTAADMFSYGMLAFCVHNGKSLYQCDRNWGVFKRKVGELKSLPHDRLTRLPTDLVDYIKLMLSPTSELRPTPEEIQQLTYFQDVGVKTLQLLDSQFQWDNLQKSQFYKGLPSVMGQLPERVLVHRVYPCLAKEFVNPSMVPFVLPPAFQIAESVSKDDFAKHILPALKPVMKMMDPIQILLIFMQNMKLLLDKTPVEDVKTDVMPMLYRALECDDSQIQELCLSILPEFAGLLDKQSLKTALLPRIKKVCISTRLLSVRVNSLICLGKLLEHLDKWQVVDEILPMLAKIPSREPAVIMGIVGIYKISLNSSKLGLSKEVMANKVLPFLIPLSIENGLSVVQYDAICDLVKDMVKRIETEHRSKLHQLNSLQDEHTKSFNSGLSSPGGGGAGHLVNPSSSMSALAGKLDSTSFDGFEAKVEARGTSGPASDSVSKGQPASKALSLQEKQRMLKEQENLQNQSKRTGATSSMTVSPSMAMGTTTASNNTIPKSTSLNQLSGQQWAGSTTGWTNNSGINPMPANRPMLNNNLTTAGKQPMASMSSMMMMANMPTTTSTTGLGQQQSVRLTSMAGMIGPSSINNSINQLGMLQPMNVRAPAARQVGPSQTKPLSQAEINDLLG